MQKTFVVVIILALLGLFITFGVWIGSIVSNHRAEQSVSPDAARFDSASGRYISDDESVTVVLPDDYEMSSMRTNAKEIFAAASSKVLLNIRAIDEEVPAGMTHEQMLTAIGEQLQTTTNPAQLSYGPMELITIGSRLFLFTEASRSASDGFNTDFVAQYVTIGSRGAFIIDFVTPWKDAYDFNTFDKIVMTMEFK